MRLVPVLVAVLAAAHAAPLSADQQNSAVTREVTIAGKVTRLDPQTRGLTCELEGGGSKTVRVDREVKVYDDLKLGDVVTVRYVESVVVAVRRGANLKAETDTTAAAKREPGGENIEVQSRAIVTIERIDLDDSVVEYRTADRQRVVRRVWQRNLLDGLRVGDIVEVTYTVERAIHVERRR